jgi:hypothetical protein
VVGHRATTLPDDPVRPVTTAPVALKGCFLPLNGFLVVGVGAALGAWLRWAFGTWLNSVFPTVPLGTLSANRLSDYRRRDERRRSSRIFACRSSTSGDGLSGRIDHVLDLLSGDHYVAPAGALQVAAVLLRVAGLLCMTALGVLLIRAHLGE